MRRMLIVACLLMIATTAYAEQYYRPVRHYRPQYAQRRIVHRQATPINETKNRVMMGGALLILAVAGTGIVQGCRRRAVFFYDGWDVALSFLPIVLLIGCANIKDPRTTQWASWGVLAGSVIYHLARAYLHNYGMVLLPIAIFTGRILICIVIPVMWLLWLLSHGMKREEDRGGQLADVVVTAGLMYVIWRLIRALTNGKYVNKGYHDARRFVQEAEII